MSGSFVKNNGTVTITFEYTTELAKAQAVVDNIIEELYDRGYSDSWPLNQAGERELPANLNNTQMIDIVDSYVRRTLVNLARSRDREEREETARQEAAAASDNIDL
jgi:hypothetical protein